MLQSLYVNKEAPEYLPGAFTLIRGGATNNLDLQKPNTKQLKKTFSYRSAKLWNSLPLKVKTEHSMESFRKTLRLLGTQSSH